MTGKRIIDPAERERRRLTLLDRDREHTSAGHYGLTPDQQRARTMKLRHLAAHGCMARTVGCE